MLVPGVVPVDGVAERVPGDEHLLVLPTVVERRAEEDADAEVDVDQVVGHQLPVDDDTWGDVHGSAPFGHVPVPEVADVRVLEGTPAGKLDAAVADLVVARHGLEEEVEEVVVHGHDALHELHVAHQPADVVGEELDRGGGADAARVQRRGVNVAPLHQAEHLTGVAADLQRLAVELTAEGVQRPHDVADRLVAVVLGVRRLGAVGPFEDAGVRLGHHLLAVVDPDEVLLEDVVVEHELGGLAQVHDPLGQVRRTDVVRHVLGVARARGVVVAADPADAAGDEMGVARVLALHEDAVAAEDRGGAVALGHPPAAEVDLGVDPQASDDPGDGIPRHLHQLGLLAHRGSGPLLGDGHRPTFRSRCSRSRASCRAFATSARRRASWP